MNHRIASAITFSSTVAVATIAAAFLSSNAFADDITDRHDTLRQHEKPS